MPWDVIDVLGCNGRHLALVGRVRSISLKNVNGDVQLFEMSRKRGCPKGSNWTSDNCLLNVYVTHHCKSLHHHHHHHHLFILHPPHLFSPPLLLSVALEKPSSSLITHHSSPRVDCFGVLLLLLYLSGYYEE